MAELYHFFTVDEIGTQRDHWRYTDAKRSISFGGNLYEAQPIKGEKWSRDLRDQRNEIVVPAEMQPFPIWLPSDPGADLWLEVFLHPDGRREFKGRVLGVEFQFPKAKATIRLSGASGVMSGEQPQRTYGPFCDWDVYRNGCFVDVAQFEKFVDMAEVLVFNNGRDITSNAFATKQDNVTPAPDIWWALGYVEKGVERRKIINSSGIVIHLMTPLLPPYAGILRLVPGCDKSIGTCNAKFNNLIRYSGYARVPRKNPAVTRL